LSRPTDCHPSSAMRPTRGHTAAALCAALRRRARARRRNAQAAPHFAPAPVHAIGREPFLLRPCFAEYPLSVVHVPAQLILLSRHSASSQSPVGGQITPCLPACCRPHPRAGRAAVSPGMSASANR
jgi:hypothetical protein